MKNTCIACMILIFAACKKKNENYVAPQKNFQHFETPFLTHFKQPRLFTSQGEITNPALVNQYTVEFTQYLYDSLASLNDPRLKSFTWVSDDSLLNTSMAPVAELKRTTTDVYDKYSGRFITPVNDTSALWLHIVKYPMHWLATTPLGYTYAEYETESRIIKKVNDTLFLPIIRYVVVSRHDNTFSFAADKINNVFSAAGIGKMANRDTLLVQAFDLGLKKTK